MADEERQFSPTPGTVAVPDDNDDGWEAVDSSRFKAMKHDPETNRLWIIWTNGQKGYYEDVPTESYEKLRAADSLGKHLNAEIIPHHQYKRDS